MTNDFNPDLIDSATGVQVQSDGAIVASISGTVTQSIDFTLARFSANGSLDQTFVAHFPGYSASSPYDLVVQSDGRIVVAGEVFSPSFAGNFAVARFLSTGALDSSFSGDGMRVTRFSPGDDSGLATALQPNGRILVVGFTSMGAFTRGIAAARYLGS